MKRLSILPVALIMCICLTGCHAKEVFIGNVISNDDIIQMEYTVFDCHREWFMTLSEEDLLNVSYACESGTVEITVGTDGDTPLYEGNGLTDIEFSLNIQKSGTYRIALTGHNAKGSISFTKGQLHESVENP